jgi:hypothetical protein
MLEVFVEEDYNLGKGTGKEMSWEVELKVGKEVFKPIC